MSETEGYRGDEGECRDLPRYNGLDRSGMGKVSAGRGEMIARIVEEAYLIFYENSVFEIFLLEEDDARRKLRRIYLQADEATIDKYIEVVGRLRTVCSSGGSGA